MSWKDCPVDIVCWDDSLRTGVARIDNEHRLICSLINDLQKVAEAPREVQSQILEEALAGLHDAIRRHFASEEHIMVESSYPDYAAHCQRHRLLERQLEVFMIEGTLVVNEELVCFLHSWFLEHVQADDLAYAVFLQKS